ncbi:uncharacterized protein EI97DRAFT_194528 [Westerdykella ornata]|uniref:Uncharacterized protein n=1 Tax=Westerdykella ornata TaxID=318751 RepID=A0A6A6J9R5_WESOR|nr:uncharacterized protein EI97DRAFT_194528 [Westerdykella ornata]KAF2272913.1 hypothetical protein EI97DRAFT_194528 [Westerdykella ornata]
MPAQKPLRNPPGRLSWPFFWCKQNDWPSAAAFHQAGAYLGLLVLLPSPIPSIEPHLLTRPRREPQCLASNRYLACGLKMGPQIPCGQVTPKSIHLHLHRSKIFSLRFIVALFARWRGVSYCCPIVGAWPPSF